MKVVLVVVILSWSVVLILKRVQDEVKGGQLVAGSYCKLASERAEQNFPLRARIRAKGVR